jgi:sugar O-acyltransferase (sialic acid O-acetyltransferase NeuD family)
MARRVRMLGAGGHAKVAAEAWRSTGGEVIALHDDDAGRHGRESLGIRIESSLAAALATPEPLHIAIGSNEARRLIAAGIPGERFPPIIHRHSVVSPTATVSAGALVCAGAVVQACARIGFHAIINSAAVVEHDVMIGDFAHVAPGARLGGGVEVGEAALIGIGAIVLPGLSIGAGAIVGAGAVVIADVAASTIVVGNPARPL